MNAPIDPGSAPEPYFHQDSAAVRCWVLTPAGFFVGAIVRKELLHHGFHGALDGSDALDTFHAHRAAIEAAVLRRVAGGSIEPVLLREADLKAPMSD